MTTEMTTGMEEMVADKFITLTLEDGTVLWWSTELSDFVEQDMWEIAPHSNDDLWIAQNGKNGRVGTIEYRTYEELEVAGLV